MRKKTPMLPRSTRQRIGKYYKKNPDATFGEIAEKFNCTYDQARRACHDYRDGKLTRTALKVEPSDFDSHNLSSDEMLEKQFEITLAQLNNDVSMALDLRAQLLKDLFGMRKTFQTIKLQGHLKQTDAVILSAIIRRFEPEATDDRIIEIYREELVKIKG